ncbi:ABC transporter substrate-binding protein [Psychrobacter sp. T6-1]|uniref:ABC transporter substrate-binding protein n=1 Tax=Psychrobacter sp. T6-1 TaxID=3457447 RepID=UPI00293D33DD|nr:ABC transporter substrate-binding protein [uncultured Psychrobacter sp.]
MKWTFKTTLLALSVGTIGLVGCSNSETPAASGTDTETAATTSDVPVQGVTDTEILLGSANDLSGPFAGFGNPAVAGANMYFDEVNAAGGVNGRMIRYIVEDHSYQVPKAVQSANKLVSRDKVFAMLMSLGTPHNLASFPIMDRANVPSVMPLTFARAMQEEGDFDRRYTSGSTYYDSIKLGMEYLIAENNMSNICVMYIPSDYGEETNEAAKDITDNNPNVTLVMASSHRPDETDFAGAIAKLKEADCDLVALSLTIRGAITAVGTANAMGWTDVKFVAPVTGFHPAVADAPGGASEGLYAVSYYNDLALRANEPETKAFVDKYKAATGEDVSAGAILGYLSAKVTVEGLKAAGKDLNADTFNTGMETVSFVDGVTGSTVAISPESHVAINDIYLSQVQNGAWKTVTQLK